jgi:riboflavin synthase
MFTGLITDVGTVVSVVGSETQLMNIEIEAAHFNEFELGESIACDGVCLTVAAFKQFQFAVQAAPETLRKTALSAWKPGRRVNLEKALRAGDRLGGHLVQGHVDAPAALLERRFDGQTLWLTFELPVSLQGLVVEKGSICIDGISLTVTHVTSHSFSVMLIPQTVSHTTLGTRAPPDLVNLEVDMIGKYVASMMKLRFP